MAERKTDEEIAREMVAENDPMLAQEPEIEDEIDSIESVDAVAELKRERDEMRDRFMRALADAENTRKRAERDRREAENYGGSKLARDMLPVYDSLERALMMATEDGKDGDKALLEGVELTMRELRNVFKKHGVEVIRPEIGERFDPQLHEAMFEAPLPGTKAGDIIQVSASGFMLHDRLLRPAQVGVSSTPAS
ncbi:MAG: nucleotide exchange factor GrpE [Thalassobium sp.]|uniref:nucleotide exchange factor GrpE n=1 Tax=Octadecabacter sp. SW4 TaxID=2602067 RepID=UPI000C0D4FD3|nr:nucleotide exchange factor GrpE [Octadecabacter sp. SW4]PHQ86769.1 MAG: nucleotide exchange factor GrpE [Thalassobium sp.]QEE37087.1 nucleotide exchange factor GrpE [Octadecabacter sp. SW4]